MSKKTNQNSDIRNLITVLSNGADPEDHKESITKARCKLAVALELNQCDNYKEGQYQLALSKAQQSAKVKRTMRSSRIEDKIQAKLEEARAINSLSEQDKALLVKPKATKEDKGNKAVPSKGKAVTVEAAELPQ